MWTRAELKARAKANLSRYYGTALFVSFIANMFTSSGGGGGSTAGGAAGGVNAGAGMSEEMGIPMQNLESIIADVPGAVYNLCSLEKLRFLLFFIFFGLFSIRAF